MVLPGIDCPDTETQDSLTGSKTMSMIYLKYQHSTKHSSPIVSPICSPRACGPSERYITIYHKLYTQLAWLYLQTIHQ